MTNTKQEWKKFGIWLRNGFCYGTTWFILLLWIYCKLASGHMMPVDFIPAVMLGVGGAVLIFCSVFTKVFIRKFGFTVRFTLFMALTVLYELAFGFGAYHWADGQDYMRRFAGLTPQGWLIFIGIVLAMYGISMAIYAVYRRKYGALYTEALQKYQKSCAE